MAGPRRFLIVFPVNDKLIKHNATFILIPFEKFLDDLSDEDAAAVNAAMKELREDGTRVAHFIRNDIYEVIAPGKDRTYRILFSQEGKHDHILLALEGFPKKTVKVPDSEIRLAEMRLADWRSHGRKSSH